MRWLNERPADTSQYALWAEAEIDPSISGGGFFVVTIHGDVDERDLKSAALAVLHRHEPLRSVLRLVDGRLRQFLMSATEACTFVKSELACERGTEKESVRAWMEEHEQRRNWDLSAEAPIRFNYLTHDVNRASIAFAAHHAGFDGRSKYIVAQDFTSFLREVRSGQTTSPTPLSAPETPVAPQEVVKDAIAFWRRTMDRADGPMALPEGGQLGRRVITSSPTVDLDSSAITALRETARNIRVSTFTMLIAALLRQLAAYGNGALLPAMASDMSDERTQHIAGLQVNVVPVAIDIEDGASTEKFVEAARRLLSDLARFRRVPFVDLIAGLPGKPMARLGTQLGVSFPRPPADLDLAVPGLHTQWDFFTPNTSATFARTLQIRADWPNCKVRLDYRQDIMGPAEAELFLSDFRDAVSNLAANHSSFSRPPAVADQSPAELTSDGKPYTCDDIRVGTLWIDDPLEPPRLVPAAGFSFTAHSSSGRPLPRFIAGAVHVQFPDGRVMPTHNCGYIAGKDDVRLLGADRDRWFCTRSLIDASAVTRVARTHPWVNDAKVVLKAARTETAVLIVTGSDAVVPTTRQIRTYLRSWIHASDIPGHIEICQSTNFTKEG